MKLKDIVSIVTDYVANESFASLRKNAKYVSKEGGFARVIRLTNQNNKYDDNDAVYVNQASYGFLSKSKLAFGDIIVTNVGAYLYSNYGHNKLLELISGSAMPKFNKTALKNMGVAIHSKDPQSHIVNIVRYSL